METHQSYLWQVIISNKNMLKKSLWATSLLYSKKHEVPGRLEMDNLGFGFKEHPRKSEMD